MPFKKPETVDIDGFELVKYGSLLGEEQEWIEAQQMRQVNQAIPMLEIASAISKEKSVDGKTALAAVQSFGGDGDLAPLLLDHIEALKQLQYTVEFEQQLPRRIVTTLIQSRVTPEWMVAHKQELIEAFPRLAKFVGADGEWDGTWSNALTKCLPEATRNRLTSFFMGEQREWAKLPNPAEAEERSLGESSTTSTTSKKQGSRTGTKSRGFSSKTE